MKKRLLSIIPFILLTLVFFQPQIFAQPMGPGMMGQGNEENRQGENWNYCPYCGSYLGQGGGYGMMGPGMMGRGYYGMGPGMMGGGYGMMGPGMMGRGYYGMGPGMMGPGYGPGPGYGYGPRYQQQPREPMDEKAAKDLVENYLQSTRNPNLKLGKIESKGDTFEAEITTKTGSLVDKIAIDKYTGWMRSVY